MLMSQGRQAGYVFVADLQPLCPHPKSIIPPDDFWACGGISTAARDLLEHRNADEFLLRRSYRKEIKLGCKHDDKIVCMLVCIINIDLFEHQQTGFSPRSCPKEIKLVCKHDAKIVRMLVCNDTMNVTFMMV